MFLSHLMIDTGGNPDRPRPGRRWLSNVYHVHQRLSMAFPSSRQLTEDGLFLRPFTPSSFERPRFLFRIDNVMDDACDRVVILVQSEIMPNWGYAFQNASMFLAAAPEVREYNPTFETGSALRFRIRMNLSKKSSEHRTEKPGRTDAAGRTKSQGKRVSCVWERASGETADKAIEKWFSEKGARCGYAVRRCLPLHLGWVIAHRSRANPVKEDDENGGPHGRMRFRSTLLEGLLTVTDEEVFARTLSSGIGSAKAFGFGLLSVIPHK